ncbi:C2 domain-containing protein 5 isoform X3 [Schistocerca americana]|uniref:C2 domain-containing protein 5 isoform X3 n=1 Tax=Schistocerca americana TaxID=7009 RepID=UPI001F4FB430|nr:C2 domain-containing protein 5 isoform X3 [Schistocerca americana]
MTGTRNTVERSDPHSSDCNPDLSDWFGIVHRKMPGKVKVKILAGRNLPVMDRSSDTTDAYVEIKLGNTTYKTDVYRKSLNPQWNSDWYKYEVDDSELQDEPLQIRLMDHDTYSANDAIGKVYLDLNPLLLPSPPPIKNTAVSEGVPSGTNVTGGATMAGWIPVFDTMHGIRGEVNIIVKVELFSDFNKFRQSSCGVQFFCSPVIPQGYHAQVIHGFVEELVVNDDPEYQWIDKIRTPRASNEARQTLFFKLSGEVQRKIGLKALDLGGNAVIGYHQCFDLEGESGIVVRGIGTAVTLTRINDVLQPSTTLEPAVTDDRHVAADDAAQVERTVEVPLSLPSGNKISPSPAKIPAGPSGICRRSSDSDLSITPKGNSLTGSDRSSNMGCHFRSLRPTVNQDNMEMLEYPFLTMRKYGPGFIQHLGGTISARSVKLLERITNLDEPESRDSWWTELRMEVRSHARAIGCNVVLGYSEHTSICDDVCVLSASGTAAFIQMDSGESATQHPISRHHLQTKELMTTSLDRTDFEKDKPVSSVPLSTLPKMQCVLESSDGDNVPACSICHIPYSESSVPFRVTMMKCVVCGRGKVPDVLLTTIEPPEGLPTMGKGCFLQAYVCRPKRVLRGELNAKEISDGLPFLEYELHRLLLIKLKLAGMNSIFGLKVEVAIGEKMMIALATGTAIFLSPLPVPPIPKISCANPWTDEKRLNEIQKSIVETVKKNRDLYQLKNLAEPDTYSNGKVPTFDTEDSDDERPALELSTGNKDTWIFEIDDSEDVDKLSLLIDPRPPEGFHTVNIETVPGLDELEVVRNLQMFTQVWRAKISSHQTHVGAFSQHINRLLQSVYFKLRRLVPCALCNLEFRVELPEIDEVQLSVLGMAIGLSEPEKMTKIRKKIPTPTSKDDFKKLDEGDMIFNLEEDHDIHVVPAPAALTNNHPSRSTISSAPFYKLSNVQNTGDDDEDPKDKMVLGRERYGVDITPLSYIPGAKIERYLGNLNFFFIRESTSIREAGGLSGFVHSFVTEVLAILRAHVTALGGNAMVAYFMSECVLYHNPHKNQGQCLINVGGDVVCATYYTEE